MIRQNKILITGGSGFIGTALREICPGAVNADIQVGVDILKNLPDEEFTHVFHVAALRSIPDGEANPEAFIRTNCLGTHLVLKKYPNARVINISSSSVNNVQSVYGATKLFGEAIARRHPNCLSVRLYNVFGEGQPLSSGAVVPSFIRALLRNESPVIYGDGKTMRDMTYVRDVVYNLYDLMFLSEKTGLLHLGYGEPVSINQLAELIFHPNKVTPTYLPGRDCDLKYSKSPVKMNHVYGRLEGLKRTINWYRKTYGTSEA
jgi:UDP-glucose 4-epimerase